MLPDRRDLAVAGAAAPAPPRGAGSRLLATATDAAEAGFGPRLPERRL